jgi:hypothetical protein
MPKDPRSSAPVSPGRTRLTASLWNRTVESIKNAFLHFVPPLYHDESTGNVYMDLSIIGARIAKTPGGGIPAATGTSPPSPGSANCVFYNFNPNATPKLTAAETQKVYTITSAVAANTFIIVTQVQGYWFVVVELCP